MPKPIKWAWYTTPIISYWFEVGRVELLRQFGFSYKDMERADDCFIAVVDARCRYKAPVHYDDEVIVRRT